MSMLSRFATLGGGGDPYWANVSYLLVGNGANGTTTNIKDSSSNNVTTTITGSPVISTAQNKFGSGSVYFNNAIGTNYLSLANNTNFNYGTSDFTIEFWVYIPTFSQSYMFAYSDGNINNYIAFIQVSTSSYKIEVYNGVQDYNGSVYMPTAGWNFVAISRVSGILKTYINGVLDTNAVFGSFGSSSNTPKIAYSLSYPVGNGLLYLYDFRITTGVARYTGSTMTVPTAPLPIG